VVEGFKVGRDRLKGVGCCFFKGFAVLLIEHMNWPDGAPRFEVVNVSFGRLQKIAIIIRGSRRYEVEDHVFVLGSLG